MPGIRATSGALAVVACAVGLAACGGDEENGLIPQDAGEALIAQLDEVQSAVEQGECATAQEAAVAFAQGVNDLPPEVTGELRDRLVEASTNLESLSETQCEELPAGASGEEGVLPTTPTTTTSTTETTTTDTTNEEPPPEPDEGDDEGDGAGQPGGGNAGGGSNDDSGSGDDSGGIGSDG